MKEQVCSLYLSRLESEGETQGDVDKISRAGDEGSQVEIYTVPSVKTRTQINLNRTCLKEFTNLNIYINIYIQ